MRLVLSKKIRFFVQKCSQAGILRTLIEDTDKLLIRMLPKHHNYISIIYLGFVINDAKTYLLSRLGFVSEKNWLSDRKLDEIETMFKKSTKPKLEIDEYPKIERIGCVLDSSQQGHKAMNVATALAKRLDTLLNIIISEDFYEPLEVLIDSAQKELELLEARVQEHVKETNIKAKIDQVTGEKLKKILELFQHVATSEETLGGQLIQKIRESEAHIMVIGVPLFKEKGTSELGKEFAKESLGRYALMLLRERTIPANFLLVSGKTEEITDKILAFVDVEQQPASIVALYRRALSFATEKTEFKIVGIVENKVIETVARLNLPEEDPDAVPDLEGVADKLKAKMEDTLDSITLKKEIDDVIIRGSPTYEVKTGSIAEIVREYLDEFNPGIVFVRSVAELSENLDPFAEYITRQVLSAGCPVLILWD